LRGAGDRRCAARCSYVPGAHHLLTALNPVAMHTSVRVLVPSPLMILFRVITTPPHVGHQFAYAISVYPLRWRTSAASCCSVIASRLSSKSGVRRFPNFAPLLIHDFINRSADWFASAMFMSLTSMLATSGQLATVTYPVQRIGDKSE